MILDFVQQGQEPERNPNPNQYIPNPYSHNNPQHVDATAISELTIDDYGLSPDDIKAEMFGINVVDPQTGEPLPAQFYKSKVEKAISKAEQTLDIAIFPRYVSEHQDFHSQNASSYMYTHTYKRPIIQVEDIKLEMSGRTIKAFPRDWWNVYSLSGHIEIMSHPVSSALGHSQGLPTGQLSGTPFVGHSGMGGYTGSHTYAPQMIHVEYIAGLLPRKHAGYNQEYEMPATLESYIMKLAVREIIQVYGRLIAPIGVQGHSLTIDGISETINSTGSATKTNVSGLLATLDEDLSSLENSLKSYYGANMTSV